MLPLRSVGTRPPLFCMHTAGGFSWCYARLGQHVDAEYPIYGLQARHLTEPAFLPKSFEEVAADSIAEIRKVQPTGPYHLVGWSFGGLIAYMVATLLQQQGDEVALLAILDAYPPIIPEGPMYLSRDQIIEALCQHLEYDTEDGCSVSSNPVESYRRLADHMGNGYPLDAMIDEIQNNHALLKTFGPRRYDGELLFFTATDSENAPQSNLEAWRPYISGEIEVHRTACLHQDMLNNLESSALIGQILTAKLEKLIKRRK